MENNFADSQFTVKAKALDFELADIPDTDRNVFIADIKILEVYYGNIAVNDVLQLHIEWERGDTRAWKFDDFLQGEFITNFCLSETGQYFTDDMYASSNKTISALNRYISEGTSEWQRHDCYYSRWNLNDPDSLDYIKPQPKHGGNHSNLYWRDNAAFQTAYIDAISKTGNPDWINNFKGIGRSRDSFNLDGTQWLHISLCDPDNCTLHSTTILYSQNSNKVVALISDQDTYFVGEPSDSAKSLLLTLHSHIYSIRGDSVEKRLYDPETYTRMQARHKKNGAKIAPLVKLYGMLVDKDIED